MTEPPQDRTPRPAERPRGERRGGRRKWPNGKPGLPKGAEPFDPLSQTWTRLGQSSMAKKARSKREQAIAESEWLARHFQLDPEGRLPETERAGSKGVAQRKADRAWLTDFPRIPDGELERLEGIIKRYGLPMAALSSDTAAFVVRRVMMDYHRLSNLRRTVAKPMFTPEELVELMRVLQVKPAQLADMVAPGIQGGRNNSLGSIHRWMHGASKPTSILAVKINRLIEQNVRRKRTGGFPGKTLGVEFSDKPQTVERRDRVRRARKRNAMEIPVSPTAMRELERKTDATEGPSGERPPDGGE